MHPPGLLKIGRQAQEDGKRTEGWHVGTVSNGVFEGSVDLAPHRSGLRTRQELTGLE